jgi:hypothetical protein
MKDFKEQKDFIKYWDAVVNLWLDNPQDDAIDARRPLPEKKTKKKDEEEDKKECYYKEEFKVNMENGQMAFFENESLGKLLCPAHLPEPYWGNPDKDKCSIVVVDYNPAGGTDMNPHSYKGTINGSEFPPNTIINYVKKWGYSKFATEFPIWKKDLPEGMKWLCSYGGRKWWLKKKKWIQHLVGQNSDVEEVPPFAIELCGWHSPNWPDNTDAFKNDTNLKNHVRDRFALPLLEAIDNSKSHLAICIGAQFKPSILDKYIPGLKNITESIYAYLKGEGITYPDNPGKKERNQEGDESISVTVVKGKDKTTRYYRVYNVVSKDKSNHIILNTFAPGSNHHPAKEYWEFEKKLLKAIEEWKKTGHNTLK